MNHTHSASSPWTTTLKFLAACTTSPMSGLGRIMVSAVVMSLNTNATSGDGCSPAMDRTRPERMLKCRATRPSLS